MYLDSLVENHCRHLATALGARHEPAQPPAALATLDDDHPPVPLQAYRHGAGIPVERELAGVLAAGGYGLDGLERTRPVVDGEVDERVRHDLGAVAGIKVGDLKGVRVAR